MTTFKNPLDPENIAIKKAIHQWVTQRLGLEDDTHIEITEYRCSEASCVHAETVISVLNAQNTEGGIFFKITKPLVFIRKIDIALMQKMMTKPRVHQH